MHQLLGRFTNCYRISLSSIENHFERPRNMIINHGLMGSAKNFRSISKHPSISKYVNVHITDSRNHGDSDHTLTHTIQDLADDLMEYIKEKELDLSKNPENSLTLMGHSMGALTLMEFTKRFAHLPEVQKLIERVILIDISPRSISKKSSYKDTGEMLQNMNKINLQQPIKNVFSEIDRLAYNPATAGLIKNSIVPNAQKDDHSWKVNLPVLVEHYPVIGSYELLDEKISSALWKKPVDVIYGAKSGYVEKEDIEVFKKAYPQMTDRNFHCVEDAGHWVHFDQTKEFLRIVESLLQKKSE